MKRETIIGKAPKKSDVFALIGEDGDVFIGYEGGVPIRAREMLTLYYEYSIKAGDMWLLDKTEIKRQQKMLERIKRMEYKKETD